MEWAITPVFWGAQIAAYLGGLVFTLLAALAALRPPLFVRQWFAQTARLGYRCLLPVVLVVGAFAAVVTIQGLLILDVFGAQHLMGGLLTTSFYQELAPVLTGIMVAVQGGSAVAAELGTMRLREEIDALKLMAVDPVGYLVVPRLIGFIVVTPCLCLIAGVSALVVGLTVAVYLKGVGYGEFVNNLYQITSLWDILYGGIIKALVYGFLIGLVAVDRGWRVRGTTREVGQAANQTVVRAIMAIFIFNSMLTNLLFGITR